MVSKDSFMELYDSYAVWQKSQEGQKDGYAYEKSFDDFVQAFNRRLLEKATEPEMGTNERLKKKSKPDLGP